MLLSPCPSAFPAVKRALRIACRPNAAAIQAFPGGLVAGQVAIITGSGQGIGRAAAILFAQEGASVVVTDIDAVKSDAVAQEIKDFGGKAISYPGDITDPAFPDGIVKAALDAFGKINHIVVRTLGRRLLEAELSSAGHSSNAPILFIGLFTLSPDVLITFLGVFLEQRWLHLGCYDPQGEDLIAWWNRPEKAQKIHFILLFSVQQMTDKQWDTMLLVHNTAPFRLVRAAAGEMVG